jgi:two-component system chemotaxis sensor kinase CheA
LRDIRQKLLATFQVEHRDHVEQIRSLLAMIEQTGVEPAGALDEAFRRVHSLKGAARAVDLRPVEGLAHRLETLFSRVRQGVLILDKELSGVVKKTLDASEDCMTAASENGTPASFGEALRNIDRALGIESESAGNPATNEPASLPSAPAVAFQPLETVRITAQNFDGLLRSAGGLLVEAERQNQVTAQLDGIARQVAGMETEVAGMRRTAMALLKNSRKTECGAKEFVRGLPVRAAPFALLRLAEAPPMLLRLTSFFDFLEGRARTLAKQTAAARRLQRSSSWNMTGLGKQLQRDVWQARMVPAESLLEGYRKMVRELARDEGKEIEFRASSTGVHADRMVLEALKDPVMHLLRNAVSHGIESPDERALKGKSPVGLVSLRLDTKGQSLTIVIEDDGKGVDLARVAEVALAGGILSEAEAARSTPRELARILFRPGFSTSRSVTHLSGRGMGLSVVHETVRRLRGNVDLQPRDGAGISVHLSVPQSISTHRLLLVASGGQTFAIRMHAIERLHRIKLENIQTLQGKPFVTLDDVPVPLVSLEHLFHLEPSQLERDTLPIVVLRAKDGRVAIAVHAFLREMESVIQDLGPAAPGGGTISGGILLEDGGIAFVLGSPETWEPSRDREFQVSVKPMEQARKPSRSILVVDDSLTTRTLEKSILEASGYRVSVAVDGIEALAKLRAEKADLVITDVQMPRLDGFGLLEAMKQDRDLAGIPVVVVTSLERREDQERGLHLGADAYIVKRKFDQGELLAAIRQIL